jgi:predicted RNA binding protein YcfA (HicA-like mRNA interferase family)
VPKLTELKPKKILKMLEQAGFAIDHVSGSHYILHHMDGRRVTLPFHAKELPKGTVYSILKSAGLI